MYYNGLCNMYDQIVLIKQSILFTRSSFKALSRHIICSIYISKKKKKYVLTSCIHEKVQLKYEKEDSLHLHRQKRTSWVSRSIGVHIGWPFKTLSKVNVFLTGPFILLLYYSLPESQFDRKYVRAQSRRILKFSSLTFYYSMLKGI